jgi:two-component system, OmpR family, response regulator
MKKHILIVDDEAAIRNLLTEFLTRSGYRVTDANSPTEAQRIVQQDPPQLIISDLQLADSDGLEMLDQLKAALPDTPMMLLTGVLFDPKVIREVLSKKVSSYLQKTSSLAQVLAEVHRLVGPP